MADRIMVSRGFTRNLTNFESARYDARYESDIREGETPEQAYARVRDFVDSQLTSDIENDN